jgi:hypothetical protein
MGETNLEEIITTVRASSEKLFRLLNVLLPRM